MTTVTPVINEVTTTTTTTTTTTSSGDGVLDLAEESEAADLFGEFDVPIDEPSSESLPVSSSDILTPEEKAQNESDRKLASIAKGFDLLGCPARFNAVPLTSSALKAKAHRKNLFVEPISSKELPKVPEILAPGIGCMIPPRFDPASMKGSKSVEFDMSDYCRSAVQQYKELAGIDKLKHAPTPFLPDGSLVQADESERGQMAGSACKVLMKDLWLGRLSRPDLVKPITDLATKVQRWSRNHDKQLFRLICYMNSTSHYRLTGKIGDPPEKLRLLLFVHADLAGDNSDSKSRSGGYLVLAGPNTWFPITWISRKQTSTSRSTMEAEVVALAVALFSEAIPTLQLFDILLGRKVDLYILEDNQSTIRVCRTGFSPKLRHVSRTHKINLGSVSEALEDPHIYLEYCHTSFQAADIFTKSLPPAKWPKALELLGMKTDHPRSNLSSTSSSSSSVRPSETSSAEPSSSSQDDIQVQGGVAEEEYPVHDLIRSQHCESPYDTTIVSRGLPAAIRCVFGSLDEEIKYRAAHGIYDGVDKMVKANTMLDRVASQVIRQNGDFAARRDKQKRPSGKLPGWGKIIELCTSSDSTLGKIAHDEYEKVFVHRVTKDDDFSLRSTLDRLLKMISDCPGYSVHASLPCTIWSQWQRLSWSKKPPLQADLDYHRTLLRHFLELGEAVLASGGHVSFEWPRHCSGWLHEELLAFIHKHRLYHVLVDGCACDMFDQS